MPLRARPRGYLPLRIGAVLLAVGAAVLWGWVTWRDVARDSTEHAQAQAQLVAQYVDRLIQAQDVMHHAVRARARTLSVSGLRSMTFHRFLSELDRGQNFTHGILVMDLDRRIVASSRVYPVEVTMGERSYITGIRDGAQMFIDRIILQPGGTDSIVVATPLKIDGFDGLVVTGFNTASLSEFLKGMAARPLEAASFMRTDGMLLMRNFDLPPTMLPPDAPGRVYPAQAESGHFTATAVTDGVRRIYAFQRVADLPLVANFGVPMSAAWRDWAVRALPVIALFVLMGGFGYASAERIRRDMLARFEADANLKRVAVAERLAEERTHLMRETNHRVKNNLSLVLSLINLQMRGKSGIDGNELKTRIGAISHVHDLMYQAADAVHVDIGGLLRDIATSPAIAPKERNVTVRCDIETGILLGPDRTTPLALIAAELVTNAVKHAFRDHQPGHIDVVLRRIGAEAELRISDDGVGLPVQSSRRSGSAIVDALVAQIGGTLTRNGSNGTAVTLRFGIA